MKLNRPFMWLIVLVCAVSACTQKASDVGLTPSPTNTPVVDAFPPTGNAQEDLKAVFTRFRNVNAFSQTDLTSSKLTISYIAPNRYKIESEIGTFILIGKDSYVKLGDSWSKSEDSMGSKMDEFHETFSEKTFNGLKEIKFAGTINENDRDLYVYTFKGFRNTVRKKYAATLTVAKDEGLPRKIKFEYEPAEKQPTTYAFWYKNIVIEPPVVTK